MTITTFKMRAENTDLERQNEHFKYTYTLVHIYLGIKLPTLALLWHCIILQCVYFVTLNAVNSGWDFSPLSYRNPWFADPLSPDTAILQCMYFVTLLVIQQSSILHPHPFFGGLASLVTITISYCKRASLLMLWVCRYGQSIFSSLQKHISFSRMLEGISLWPNVIMHLSVVYYFKYLGLDGG